MLLADSTSSAEHLYVGMTRGRHHNQVCVITDAATTGHGHRPPPTPVDVLTAVMRRSSAELSATERLREELDRGEDRETLRRLHDQAVAHIERHAGPDHGPELRRLQRLRAELPALRNIVVAKQGEVTRIDSTVERVRISLSEAETQLEGLNRRHWLRRPDRDAIGDTRHRITAHERYLQDLEKQRARAADEIERSRYRLDRAERDVSRMPEVESAVHRHRAWLLSHPAELAWEADLAERLSDHDKASHPSEPHHDQFSVDDALDVLSAIDLRTINLPNTRPSTGIEQRLRETLGVPLDDPMNIPLPPLPGRGIDGPDLGV